MGWGNGDFKVYTIVEYYTDRKCYINTEFYNDIFIPLLGGCSLILIPYLCI